MVDAADHLAANRALGVLDHFHLVMTDMKGDTMVTDETEGETVIAVVLGHLCQAESDIWAVAEVVLVQYQIIQNPLAVLEYLEWVCIQQRQSYSMYSQSMAPLRKSRWLKMQKPDVRGVSRLSILKV